MKRSLKFTALLMALLMMIASFASAVLAEGEGTDPVTENPGETGNENPPPGESQEPGTSTDPGTGENSGTSTDPGTGTDPDAFTVNIVVEGADAGAVDVTFNDAAVSGTYTGTDESLAVSVAPKHGFKVISATFGVEGFNQHLSESEGKFQGTFNSLSAGYTYTLRIVAEAVPIPAKLTVETKGAVSCTVTVDGAVVDLASAQIMTGSEVRLDFAVDGEFDLSLATLTHNGATATISDASYTFTITADTSIVFFYGVVPVTVVLNGPGKLDFQLTSDSSPVDSVVNDTVGSITKTIYLSKDVNHKIIVTPALGYEVSGNLVISEPRQDKAGEVYFFVPAGPTSITGTMKASSGGLPSTNCTVRINVGLGGSVIAGGQTIVGGMGTNIVLGTGDSLTFTVVPDEGYAVDVFRVGGAAISLTDNSYTLSNIVASSTTVSVLFKSNAAPPVTDGGIGTEDIDWSAENIIVDISGGKLVKREVFDKIATLSGAKYVEFNSENGSFYIPYGFNAEGSATTVDLNITALKSGTLFDIIDSAINTASGGAPYRAFTFNPGVTLPEGTLVSFKLGSEFANGAAVLLLYNSADSGFFTKENAANPIAVSADGITGKYAYDNEGMLICSKEALGGFTVSAYVANAGGSINPEGSVTVTAGTDKTFYITAQEGYQIKQILVDGTALPDAAGQRIYNYTFENINENHGIMVEFVEAESASTEEDDGTAVVVVVLIIIFVAVAGAAALFIVKWRQEKF